MTADSGDGGGNEAVDARIDGGVEPGVDEGEALRRKFVRRDAKKAGSTSVRICIRSRDEIRLG